MNQTPPARPRQSTPDEEYLLILAIFHFVGGALAMLALFFLTVHFTFLHAVLTGTALPAYSSHPMPPFSPGIMVFFYGLYAIAGGLLLVTLILNVVSGYGLLYQKHRTLSVTTACLNCLYAPLGTILGVFTIIILLRDPVRKLYEAHGS
jgi:hypothetical protein